jgi:hypothetical protein
MVAKIKEAEPLAGKMIFGPCTRCVAKPSRLTHE